MIAVLSPHCDDAVFGCGRLLARHPGALVVTVFAGRPPRYGPLTAWDEASGFRAGEDVVAARRAEDAAALGRLGARPVWLDFCDGQYGRTPATAAVARALGDAVLAAAPAAVFIPLGLFHADHRLAHEAALSLRGRDTRPAWFAYEDAIYRRRPGLVDERVSSLRAAGLAPARSAVPVDPDDALKAEAVRCYRSQLRALSTPGRPGHHDVFEAERYWRLGP